MQAFHRSEYVGQLGERLTGEAFAELLVFGHFRQTYSGKDRLHIHTGASAEQGLESPAAHIPFRSLVITYKAVQVILPAGVGYVYKMIRNVAIFVEVFSGSQRHSAIHLPRIRTYDFSTECTREFHCPPGFPGGGRTYDGYHGFHERIVEVLPRRRRQKRLNAKNGMSAFNMEICIHLSDWKSSDELRTSMRLKLGS